MVFAKRTSLHTENYDGIIIVLLFRRCNPPCARHNDVDWNNTHCRLQTFTYSYTHAHRIGIGIVSCMGRAWILWKCCCTFVIIIARKLSFSSQSTTFTIKSFIHSFAHLLPIHQPIRKCDASEFYTHLLLALNARDSWISICAKVGWISRCSPSLSFLFIVVCISRGDVSGTNTQGLPAFFWLKLLPHELMP